MSLTKRAPALSHAGLPAGNSPLRTQSLKGSVTTAARSCQPVSAVALRRSAGVVFGVIRSTDVDTKDTFASIQAPSSAPVRAAIAASPAAIKAPLPGMLSHGTIAIGPPPARRRASSPSTSLPSAERGSLPAGPSRFARPEAAVMSRMSAASTGSPAFGCPLGSRR